MAWGRRQDSDPLLSTHAWRTTIRQHWIRLRLPCARCHRPIDYDGPRTMPNGRLNRRYLIVGHIVDRYTARRKGWTDEQINALSNTQPECFDCSNRSGARLGQQVSSIRRQVKILDRSRPW